MQLSVVAMVRRSGWRDQKVAGARTRCAGGRHRPTGARWGTRLAREPGVSGQRELRCGARPRHSQPLWLTPAAGRCQFT